jgi:hypothetical protein
MKKVLLVSLLCLIPFFMSCGSDDSTGPSDAYKVNLSMTGDKVLEFKTNTATMLAPPANPNYLISSFLTENGMTHQFSLTIDKTWEDKKEIDLSKDLNSGTIAYNAGKDDNTYRIIEGTFVVDVLTSSKVVGTISFVAVKLKSENDKITVQNGRINISN